MTVEFFLIFFMAAPECRVCKRAVDSVITRRDTLTHRERSDGHEENWRTVTNGFHKQSWGSGSAVVKKPALLTGRLYLHEFNPLFLFMLGFCSSSLCFNLPSH